MLRRRSRDQK